MRRNRPRDCEVGCVETNEQLLASLAEQGQGHHLVVLDGQVRDGEGKNRGLKLIDRIRAVDPDVAVVVVADEGSVDAAAEAIEAGGTDFLVRGRDLSQRVKTLLDKLRGLLGVIDRNLCLNEQNLILRESIQRRFQIVGESPQINQLIDQIRRVFCVPRPLLIVGERGTGKELMAQAIQDLSDRADGPMATINCAAFPTR